MLGFATMPAILMSSVGLSQPTLDGSAGDVLYGQPLAVQDTSTGFGNALLGRPDIANGSELDALYAVVEQDTLYLVLAGNFESNANRVELFFDTRPGGQNQLLGAENPDVDYGALERMGYVDEFTPGLIFPSGFAADFYITANVYGEPAMVYASYAELYVDEFAPGAGYYLGEGPARCETNDGQLTGAAPGAPLVRCTFDNSNVAGVMDGFNADWGGGVLTGLEVAIPLAALGSPAGDFSVLAFINGSGHDFVSNQCLGGIGAVIMGNLGDPHWVDLSWTYALPVTIPISTAPVGACCTSSNCSVTTSQACSGNWLGANVGCEGNPCDGVLAGRCCVDDGLSGQCHQISASECDALGGSYTDGETCAGCPCLLQPIGACCLGDICQQMREAECLTAGGAYIGDFVACESVSCTPGACCQAHTCSVVFDLHCAWQGGRYLGDGTDCTDNPCDPTIAMPHVAGGFQGWDPSLTPMTETSPGSGVWEYEVVGLFPGERHEFKITNGTWDLALPNANSWLYADGEGTVTITYDGNTHADGWEPSWDRIRLSYDPGNWTAVGDWQGWDNSAAATAMAAVGDGTYVYLATGLEAGTHYWKPVVTGTWDSISWNGRSVHTADIPFDIASVSDFFRLMMDPIVGRVRTQVVPDCDANGTPDDLDPNGDGDDVPDACDLCDHTIPGAPVDADGCPDPVIPCDDDNDGDVDGADFAAFEACVSGPAIPHLAGCEDRDVDNDGDVDQADFGASFQRCYSGENQPGDPNCNQ